MIEKNHDYFMREALKEANKAMVIDEVPVGAVVVCNDQIIARAHNYTQKLKDVTAHAEILAITTASEFLGAKFLDECTLYVTLEPCLMCAGASYWSRFSQIVYGAHDPKRGFTSVPTTVLHPKTICIGGVLEQECGQILKDFFARKRELK